MLIAGVVARRGASGASSRELHSWVASLGLEPTSSTPSQPPEQRRLLAQVCPTRWAQRAPSALIGRPNSTVLVTIEARYGNPKRRQLMCRGSPNATQRRGALRISTHGQTNLILLVDRALVGRLPWLDGQAIVTIELGVLELGVQPLDLERVFPAGYGHRC